DLGRPHAEGARRGAQAQRHARAHYPCRASAGAAQRRPAGRRLAGSRRLNRRRSTMNPGHGIRLFINEVATRDGFQMESHFIPTDAKVALIDRLSTLGYAKIEVTSFTSPKAIPALRDGEEVMRAIDRKPGVVYTALVPNVRG